MFPRWHGNNYTVVVVAVIVKILVALVVGKNLRQQLYTTKNSVPYFEISGLHIGSILFPDSNVLLIIHFKFSHSSFYVRTIQNHK